MSPGRDNGRDVLRGRLLPPSSDEVRHLPETAYRSLERFMTGELILAILDEDSRCDRCFRDRRPCQVGIEPRGHSRTEGKASDCVRCRKHGRACSIWSASFVENREVYRRGSSEERGFDRRAGFAPPSSSPPRGVDDGFDAEAERLLWSVFGRRSRDRSETIGPMRPARVSQAVRHDPYQRPQPHADMAPFGEDSQPRQPQIHPQRLMMLQQGDNAAPSPPPLLPPPPPPMVGRGAELLRHSEIIREQGRRFQSWTLVNEADFLANFAQDLDNSLPIRQPQSFGAPAWSPWEQPVTAGPSTGGGFSSWDPNGVDDVLGTAKPLTLPGKKTGGNCIELGSGHSPESSVPAAAPEVKQELGENTSQQSKSGGNNNNNNGGGGKSKSKGKGKNGGYYKASGQGKGSNSNNNNRHNNGNGANNNKKPNNNNNGGNKNTNNSSKQTNNSNNANKNANNHHGGNKKTNNNNTKGGKNGTTNQQPSATNQHQRTLNTNGSAAAQPTLPNPLFHLSALPALPAQPDPPATGLPKRPASTELGELSKTQRKKLARTARIQAEAQAEAARLRSSANPVTTNPAKASNGPEAPAAAASAEQAASARAATNEKIRARIDAEKLKQVTASLLGGKSPASSTSSDRSGLNGNSTVVTLPLRPQFPRGSPLLPPEDPSTSQNPAAASSVSSEARPFTPRPLNEAGGSVGGQIGASIGAKSPMIQMTASGPPPAAQLAALWSQLGTKGPSKDVPKPAGAGGGGEIEEPSLEEGEVVDTSPLARTSWL